MMTTKMMMKMDMMLMIMTIMLMMMMMILQVRRSASRSQHLILILIMDFNICYNRSCGPPRLHQRPQFCAASADGEAAHNPGVGPRATASGGGRGALRRLVLDLLRLSAGQGGRGHRGGHGPLSRAHALKFGRLPHRRLLSRGY
ncbi:hypothetical protein T492DRAFT_64871 [Pavlovales sp. CCMP2436]|nr:hypothetical protein T492DRAFT_64871 [Pavlovales sp. CCMP2436]